MRVAQLYFPNLYNPKSGFGHERMRLFVVANMLAENRAATVLGREGSEPVLWLGGSVMLAPAR